MLTAAQTVTAMAAQPTVSYASDPTSPDGLIVEVRLRYNNGVPFVPANLLAALTTQYGAGKVASVNDVTAKNQYDFQISP